RTRAHVARAAKKAAKTAEPLCRAAYRTSSVPGRASPSVAIRRDVGEAHEPMLILVPECQTQSAHAGTKGDHGRRREDGVRVVARLQPVVRNTRRDVMYVV